MDNYIFSKAELTQAVLITCLLFLALAVFIVLGMLWYWRRRQQHLVQMKAMQHQYETSLLETQIEIQDDTFKRISQDLHDNIRQQLALMSLQLHKVSHLHGDISTEPLRESLTRTINDMRTITRSLHPDHVKLTSLQNSMENIIAQWQQSSAADIYFNYHAVEELPDNEKLIMFRVFQELTHNVMKHAEATTVNISFDDAGSQWQLTVTDNGKGMKSHHAVGGVGLRSMASRLTMVGGTIRYENVLPHGTRVIACIPKSA